MTVTKSARMAILSGAMRVQTVVVLLGVVMGFVAAIYRATTKIMKPVTTVMRRTPTAAPLRASMRVAVTGFSALMHPKVIGGMRRVTMAMTSRTTRVLPIAWSPGAATGFDAQILK
jgi:endonuclease V-like protein UPF0215 family